jgi:hypothetical protein
VQNEHNAWSIAHRRTSRLSCRPWFLPLFIYLSFRVLRPMTIRTPTRFEAQPGRGTGGTERQSGDCPRRTRPQKHRQHGDLCCPRMRQRARQSCMPWRPHSRPTLTRRETVSVYTVIAVTNSRAQLLGPQFLKEFDYFERPQNSLSNHEQKSACSCSRPHQLC